MKKRKILLGLLVAGVFSFIACQNSEGENTNTTNTNVISTDVIIHMMVQNGF